MAKIHFLSFFLSFAFRRFTSTHFCVARHSCGRYHVICLGKVVFSDSLLALECSLALTLHYRTFLRHVDDRADEVVIMMICLKMVHIEWRSSLGYSWREMMPLYNNISVNNGG